MNDLAIIAGGPGYVILKISPIFGGIARINDLVLKSDQICFV